MNSAGVRGKERSVHLPALASIVIAASLVFVGAVRFLSYSPGSAVGSWIPKSPLGLLGYRPGSYLDVHFFKILATPSVVAVQYFLFRLLNRGHRRSPGAPGDADDRRIDFRSPWLRLVLTSLVTLCWLGTEFAKFSNPESFYPYSALEDRAVNLGMLALSQLLAFLGMKYLSFEPLFTRE